MKSYKTSLFRKKEVAYKTTAFWLSKPKNFRFTPGQYLTVFLGKDTHDFSIASSPHESYLLFTTRLRKSRFKNKLAKLKTGSAVIIRGPAGQFLLPDKKSEEVILLAGGIGITPVRSMLLAEAHAKSRRPITLFYSNRRPQDAAFLEELSNFLLKNHTLVPVITKKEGRLVFTKIRKHVKLAKKQTYYVVGPPGFVDAMVKMLLKAGISRRNIISEDFAGY